MEITRYRYFAKYILLILLISVVPNATVNLQAKDISRTELIQLTITEKAYKELRGLDIQFATGLMDSIVLAVVSKAELKVLEERGYKFEHIMHNDKEVDLYKRAIYGESMKLDTIYHTYDEILEELSKLKKAYKPLVKLKQIGNTSELKKDIWAVKISDNAKKEEDEPAILFSGAIHSDEIAGVEICMTLINHLLTNYEVDEKVRYWVDNYEIWFIPVINVDGHHVVTNNIDPRWRKNLRDNNINGILYEKSDGIDLNRNFNFNWAHGGSSDSSSSRYRGELPFSEKEAIAVRDLAIEQDFVLSVTYHSQGEVIFYPWIWHGRKAPDDKLLTKIANNLAGKIYTLKGDTTYAVSYGAGTVGQTYPWLYGALGTFDFIIETGLNRHIFPRKELKSIIENNLQGAFYMLEKMKGPGLTGVVSDAKSGKPLVADVWFPDIDSEDVFRRVTNAKYGRFYRLLEPKTYRIIISKDGYKSKILKKVKISKNGWTTLNVQLEKL